MVIALRFRRRGFFMARRQAVKDYTPLELSERISTSRNTLARWRDLGIGPPFSKLPSGKIVYPGDLFEQWLTEHLQTESTKTEKAYKKGFVGEKISTDRQWWSRGTDGGDL